MSCTSGSFHTITFSEDGVVHSFGRNTEGQLGLGYNDDVSIPIPIHNLPKIKQVSCSAHFSVCVDYEGNLWSLGKTLCPNKIETKNILNVPQKVPDIPPVLSVACGSEHICIITNDLNLWSCGNNSHGQLCMGYEENQKQFQKTPFSNITKISLGAYHTLFQNNQGGVYSCGSNYYGEAGVGTIKIPQITPILIPNAPPNIIQFFSGNFHNLFLDSEGNVFSVGYNEYGQLGLGHNANQNVLNKILNIPPMHTISCVYESSYLIDFEGNVWSFGNNEKGQLGHGDTINRNRPTKIERLKDIQQLSYGCFGKHFLAKDSQNKIFVTGFGDYGQLGTGNIKSLSIPKEIDSQYFTIWGGNLHSRAKSARK